MAEAAASKRAAATGEFIIRFRAPIGAILLALSVFMAYKASQVTIKTNFDDFFPRKHQDVVLYNHSRSYGGAQFVMLMIKVKHGDIFNYATLKKIQQVTRAIDKLPGVNHNQVFSLASYMNSYVKLSPGTVALVNFMYPKVPTTPEGIARLKSIVDGHRSEIKGYVSPDNKSALIKAFFNEWSLNYRDVFNQVQAIVKKYQDANDSISVAGEPMVRGYGYYYEPVIEALFLAAVGMMILILYLTQGDRSRWWTPVVTGTLSAIWGLGFVGIMQYNFDPVMLVIPFILTARDMSHGIQWQGRYHDEIERLGDKRAALVATTGAMLPPGFLAIMADIAGIIFISFGGIPVLQHIGLAGSVWLAGSLTMVFIFQPIFMSYLPVPQRTRSRKQQDSSSGIGARLGDWISHLPVRPSFGRRLLMGGAAVFLVCGLAAALTQRVGTTNPGTPLYRAHAKINRAILAIAKEYPSEEGWVLLRPPRSSGFMRTGIFSPRVLRVQDDLRAFLLRDPKVLQISTVIDDVIKPTSQYFHYGVPMYYAVPANGALGFELFALGPGSGTAATNYVGRGTSIVRILLADHGYQTLNDLRSRIQYFIAHRVKPDPALAGMKVEYLAGEAGLYLASDDVLYRLDIINITFVLAVVWIFCLMSYRSFVAATMFLFSCILANFGAFIYLYLAGVGLTIDTVPVISLGIGLGVDYGIYVVSRIRDEVVGGMALEDAIVLALRTTGVAVFSTFAVMIGGIVPWVFSPVLFHANMSVLLIFLMATNMIAGCLILPCYLTWARPRFVFGGERPSDEMGRPSRAGAAS